MMVILTWRRARIITTDAKTPFAGATPIVSLAALRISIAVFRDEITPDWSLYLGARAFGVERAIVVTRTGESGGWRAADQT